MDAEANVVMVASNRYGHAEEFDAEREIKMRPVPVLTNGNFVLNADPLIYSVTVFPAKMSVGKG
jgi:hypothetical protein